MSKTWVVVAEKSRARIFELENRRAPLNELQDFTYPEARAHERDLTSDLPGRAFDGMESSSHATGTRVGPKKQEAINFAKDLCDHLDAANGNGHFEKLIIIAAPAFLGLLRKNFSEPLKKQIVKEIDKNLVQHDVEAIQASLPEFF